MTPLPNDLDLSKVTDTYIVMMMADIDKNILDQERQRDALDSRIRDLRHEYDKLKAVYELRQTKQLEPGTWITNSAGSRARVVLDDGGHWVIVALAGNGTTQWERPDVRIERGNE